MKKAGLEALERACPECWDAQRRMVSTILTSADAWQVQRHDLHMATGAPTWCLSQHRMALQNPPACFQRHGGNRSQCQSGFS